ncbi:hypothetical protein [Dokdonella soli]
MSKERCLGSLFSDIEYMAEYISIARASRNVTVWLNSKAEMVCSGADRAPELPSEYLLGTYGIGADVADIQQDLVAFRNERASNAIIF